MELLERSEALVAAAQNKLVTEEYTSAGDPLGAPGLQAARDFAAGRV